MVQTWLPGLGLAVLGTAATLVVLSGLVGALVVRLVPPRGRFIELDGERIHWMELGSGPPLLLIHGLGGQLGNFTHSLVPLLADSFRVIVFDRPGSGHSSRASGSDAGVVAQAERVSRLITALGLQQPLVVGHSLGGAIALALALNHPEQLRGLALLAPLTQPQAAPPSVFRLLALRSEFVRRIVAWTIATPLSIIGSAAVLRAIFGPDRAPADFALRGGGLLTLRPASFVHASQDMAAVETDLPPLSQRYGTLTRPVSILYGRGDRILDPQRNGLLFGQLQPAAHIELVDGGHMLPVSAAALTADFIRRAAQRC